MIEVGMWLFIGVVGPFAVYLLFRIIGSALFRTWFEMKDEHNAKQGGKHESKG